ncbi:MAG: ATP-binding protein [Clostridia bacterium]|nr:ATP-binding protein [Clostridia bacterium]
MFIGRTNELVVLDTLWQQKPTSCILLYGNRFVGKTTLITEFCKGKKTVFFSALPSIYDDNLTAFSKALFSCIAPALFSPPALQDFDTVLQNIQIFSQKEPTVLVIDDFSNLYHCHPDFLRLLANVLEQKQPVSKLMVILADSSNSFMEKTVMSSQSPLYGIYDTSLRISGLSYRDCSQFFPLYSPEENAIIYGMTGGVPLYLELLDSGADLKTNIMNAFFTRHACFSEFPTLILKQELRELTIYHAIFSSIISGSCRLSEIADRVHLETGLCVKYLKALTTMGLIKKETPVASKDQKKSYYTISDLMFRFYYRFVPDNKSHITSGRIFLSYLTLIEDYIPEYMEQVLLDIVKEYFLHYDHHLVFEINQIGSYWSKSSTDHIDLLATDMTNTYGLFGTVNYSGGRPMDISDLQALIEKSKVVTTIEHRCYCLVNRSGFTNVLINKAAEDGVILLTLPQLYHET